MSEEKEIIGRRDAWQQGRKKYFTGKPCGQGHIAERYVSSGACTQCLNPFRTRVNPYDKRLIPYACPKLWVRRELTPKHYADLEKYLQTCVDTFCNHALRSDAKFDEFAASAATDAKDDD